MSIIISDNGAPAEKVEGSDFELESNLQKLIHDNPNTIPIYEIDEDTQLFIAAREFPTNSGPIDALGFDVRGNIYVIETKLQKNPDKRYVVAQALDYGASLWRHSTDFESFIYQLDKKTSDTFGEKFEEKFSSFFGEFADPDFLGKIKSNLSDGVIKFVVLMDVLHDNLKDLVMYINQNSKFDIYAVELKYYKHKTLEIIIPKLYGTEVKKEVVSTNSNSRQKTVSNKDEFRQYVYNHLQSGELSQKGADSVLLLHDLYVELAKVSGGSVRYSKAKTNFRDVVKLVVEDSEKRIPLYLDSDSSIGVYIGEKQSKIIDFSYSVLNELIRENLMRRTEKHLEGSQWFMNFKKKLCTDDDIDKFIDINKKELEKLKTIQP